MQKEAMIHTIYAAEMCLEYPDINSPAPNSLRVILSPAVPYDFNPS